MNTWKKVVSFLKAVMNWEGADEGMRVERLTTCYSCPQLDVGPEKCKECGCYVKLKVRSKNESCPLGYW